MQYKTIYDISVLLSEESVNYPSKTPSFQELLLTIEFGDSTKILVNLVVRRNNNF